MLLVYRRGDDQLTLHVAHDAARYDVRATGGIVIVDGKNLLADAKDRDLAIVYEGAHPAVRNNLFQAADEFPGVGRAHTASLRRSRRSSTVAGRI